MPGHRPFVQLMRNVSAARRLRVAANFAALRNACEPDEDNPEWTRQEMRDARPALDLIREVFGAEAAETIRRRRRRSPS